MRRPFDWNRALRQAPALAGDEAYRLFCLPPASPHRSRQYKTLAARARHHLATADWFDVPSPSGPVQAYDIDPASDSPRQGKVLIVHGWTSEAAFMSAFIEPLRRHGFAMTLFDLPAHGRSAGRSATIIDCARAVLAVAEAAGPFDTVIAHSIGGLASLLAAEGASPLPRATKFSRYVLLASPNRFSDVTRDYGEHLKLTAPAQRFFEWRLQRVGHRPLRTLQARAILQRLAAPALIVHSEDDLQVPFSSAEEICAGLPKAQLARFSQLGHAKILFAPPVIRMSRDFCNAQTATA